MRVQRNLFKSCFNNLKYRRCYGDLLSSVPVTYNLFYISASKWYSVLHLGDVCRTTPSLTRGECEYISQKL